MPQQAERPPSAYALETTLRAAGYAPGRPATYPPMAAAVDRSVARKMLCPGCGKRGMGLRHYRGRERAGRGRVPEVRGRGRTVTAAAGRQADGGLDP